MLKALKKYAGWIWRNSRGVRGSIFLDCILGAVGIALNLAFIAQSKALVDFAVSRGDDSSMLLRLSIILVSLLILRVAANAGRSYIESNSVYRVNFHLRKSLFSDIILSRWMGRENIHSGDTMNRLFSDVDVVTKIICTTIPSIVITSIQLLSAVFFLGTMNLKLALILLFITPVFAVFSKVFVRRLRALTRDIRDTESRVQSHIQESIQHKVVIMSLEHDSEVRDRLDNLQHDEYSKVRRRTRFNVFSLTVMRLAFGLGYACALLFGVYGIWEGTITFGVMTAFLQLVGQIQNPSMGLLQEIPALVTAMASADRIFEMSGAPKEKRGEKQLLQGVAGVRVENVSFRYPDGDREILKNFSHDFVPGSRTAIIGETGAGKSTLIRLMLSILSPQEGRISVYDAETSFEASQRTRVNFVYVPQGNTLFSGTIRDNLLIGNPSATEEEMKAALETAAASFVMDLPQGLDSICGEGGTGLSEGQSQRIAIARGLLRPGSIMLFDEFSSSLDPETEEKLLENLCNGNSDKTMIFITHREAITHFCSSICRIS